MLRAKTIRTIRIIGVSLIDDSDGLSLIDHGDSLSLIDDSGRDAGTLVGRRTVRGGKPVVLDRVVLPFLIEEVARTFRSCLSDAMALGDFPF